ncbi:BAG family molecular chaperone regulator 5 isoform X1 [Petromyzon marinus]|uniref:BAG family molecular chaperone regulator 5 isoform X1 n=2 Tax=Petromyzon marinus TaxID=7757 RepID=UPI003F72D24E
MTTNARIIAARAFCCHSPLARSPSVCSSSSAPSPELWQAMCEAPEWRPHAAWSPGPTTTTSAKNAAASSTSSTSSTGAASSASPASPDDTRGAARIDAVLRRASEWVQAVGDGEEHEALVEQLQEAMMQVCRIKTEGSECLRAQRSDAVSSLFSVQEVVEAWAVEAPPVEPEGPPLAELNKITEELSERRTDVLLSLLSGELSLCPARARRLASALSSLLLRLDSVEARGRQDVRRRRRAAVARTELLLRQVEPWTRGCAGHDPGDGAPRDPLLGHRALPEIRDVAAEAEDIKRLLLALPMRTAVAAAAAAGVVADGGPRPPRFRRARRRRLSNGSKARGKHAGGLATGGGEVDDEAEEDDDEEEEEETEEEEERGETEERAEEAGEEDDDEGEEERLLPRAERRLLALMERLDRVESGRNPYVRQGRRRAVLSVQGLLAHLELRRAVAEGRARQVAAPAAVGEDGRSSPVLPLHPAERAILQVLLQLCSLQREALAFRGDKSERGYALLDELLTKQLLSLDAVDTAGWAHGREARRHAVRTAQSILAYLDAKSDDPED